MTLELWHPILRNQKQKIIQHIQKAMLRAAPVSMWTPWYAKQMAQYYELVRKSDITKKPPGQENIMVLYVRLLRFNTLYVLHELT